MNNIMDIKLLITVSLLAVLASCEGKAALRRKPKVYNALITTDEDLVQSRAYPVIQPTIHESGIAHYEPYNPYGFYTPHVIKYAQPLAPAATSKEQLPYSLPTPQFPPQFMQQNLVSQPQPLTDYVPPENLPTAPAVEKPQESSIPPTGLEEQPQPTAQPPAIVIEPASAEIPKDQDQPNKMPLEQLPIPLNQYGLPPSLIPLRQPYQPYQSYPYPSLSNAPTQPFHLSPYRFNQFPPLYYNTLSGIRQTFLPPFKYLPTGTHFPLSNTIQYTDEAYPPGIFSPPSFLPTEPDLATLSPPKQPTESSLPSTDATESQPSFDDIKNGSKSKDSNVPDVPPPPIPSGAKFKQS